MVSLYLNRLCIEKKAIDCALVESNFLHVKVTSQAFSEHGIVSQRYRELLALLLASVNINLKQLRIEVLEE